jgi:hypothetical protein
MSRMGEKAMARVIKIRCNGPAQDVNEVDIDRVLRPDIVMRGAPPSKKPDDLTDLPERVVLPCRFCAPGRIVLTRDMLTNIR